jgi:hypothetical protein
MSSLWHFGITNRRPEIVHGSSNITWSFSKLPVLDVNFYYKTFIV